MNDAFVVSNIGELVTMAPLAKERRATGIRAADLGVLSGPAWLAVEHGKVTGYGQGVPPVTKGTRHVDVQSGLVMPGLVDAHTHPVFAGSRAKEFARRLDGATYQEIAQEGGGIRYTMTATRTASDAGLRALLDARLARFLTLGVTTVEAKTGYGLSVAEELRLLKVLNAAKKSAPLHVSVTCLALHAASPEHPDLASYIRACTTELLPEIARAKLADAVDAFIEAGYFSVADAAPYVLRAKELGLAVRLHADEFTDAGGASAAAEWGALSADHLQFASAKGVERMATAGVTAVLLPGTSLYTKIPFADAKRFTRSGCAVALATDYNPGSCLADNLAMIATVGAVQCGLTGPEAIAAVTYSAAKSLGLETQKGALAVGHDADFLVSPLANMQEWIADLGRTPPREVWTRGVRRHLA